MGAWWGPDGFSTTTHAIDVRTGGTWVYIMHGPDGQDYPNAMTFLDIVPHERIAYRHGASLSPDPEADFETVITLEESDGGTRVTLTSTFSNDATRDRVARAFGAVEGGRQHLENLAPHLEHMGS